MNSISPSPRPPRPPSRRFPRCRSLRLGVSAVTIVFCLSANSGERKTALGIKDDMFVINGKPTYAGRSWNNRQIEGLLLNSRMVQGIFDDLNPETAASWKYPDTGKWDAERNTREFIAAMPEWRKSGLIAFGINLQGGSPQGYSKTQPWHNSAITGGGELRPEYMARLERILDKADELGMAVMLGIFYFGQDQRLKDEAAVVKAIDATVDWLLEKKYTNVLIEVNNECNISYDHAILQPERIHELIQRVKERGARPHWRLLVSTSYGGGTIPKENVVKAADYLILHGNGVRDAAAISEMIKKTRRVRGYRPMPVLFNEDDHFDFDKPATHFEAAVNDYCGWGYFDPGQSDYADGYQCPPVNWGINTARKKQFFSKLKEITGE